MNEFAGILLWLPLVVILVVAALAGLIAERNNPQPLLLQREPHGPRSLATVRYAIDVGDSA